jgi:hypothetical protein
MQGVNAQVFGRFSARWLGGSNCQVGRYNYWAVIDDAELLTLGVFCAGAEEFGRAMPGDQQKETKRTKGS